MSGQGDLQGTAQETEIWKYEQIVYAQTRICLDERNTQTALWFWDTNGSLNLGQITTHYDKIQKNKDFA